MPSKADKELARYKSSALTARKKARDAPMEACTTGLQVAVGAAGLYGAARGQIAILDNPVTELVTGVGLAIGGMWMRSPMAVQAATGILCVAAHNFMEDITTGAAPAQTETTS